MFGVQDQHHVENMGLQFCELFVWPQDIQKVFRHGKVFIWHVDVKRFAVIIMLFHSVGVRHNHGDASSELNGLAHQVFHGSVVGIAVVRIQREHTARQLVHHVAAGRFDDHVLGEARRQAARGGKHCIELFQLFFARQLAEEQKINHLFKAKGAIVHMRGNDIFHVISAVI